MRFVRSTMLLCCIDQWHPQLSPSRLQVAQLPALCEVNAPTVNLINYKSRRVLKIARNVMHMLHDR